MSHHPTRETLEEFLLGALPVREAKAVTAHLMGGCVRCQQFLAPLASALFTEPEEDEFELSPEMDAAYDDAISAAYDAVFAKAFSQEREPVPGDADFSTPENCQALLDRSYTSRLNDPEEMLRLNKLAVLSAEDLDPVIYGQAEIADLQARAWAELANAFRIAGDLSQASRAISRAVERRQAGSGGPFLLARIADLSATLFCAQRKFGEAFRLLDMAYSLYMQQGDRHSAGRMLIARGLYVGYTGEPEEGLRYLLQGLNTIDRVREPRLAFQALHNILLLRVELGEFQEARQILRQMQPLYALSLGEAERPKLHWVEGKIAAGLGEVKVAEAAFLQAREAFTHAGQSYRAALASLDLSAVWLRQGRTAEVRQLVAEMLTTFRAVGVEREALAGILLLRDAVECEQASLELLDLIATSLGRLERRMAPPLDPEGR